MRRQEDSPPPGSQREPWQPIKGERQPRKQLLVAADEPGDAHPGGLPRRCDACIRGQAPLRPKYHHSDRIIWLQALCFVQRNAILTLLQGFRRLRGVLQHHPRSR